MPLITQHTETITTEKKIVMTIVNTEDRAVEYHIRTIKKDTAGNTISTSMSVVRVERGDFEDLAKQLPVDVDGNQLTNAKPIYDNVADISYRWLQERGLI